MKGVLVRALSPDLSGVELAELEQPEGEVLVRVRAASLNYPDLLMTRGEYQFKPEPPFVSGLEMAGEVVETPADSGFVPGDRVRGGAKTGAFADYVALPAASLRTMPENLDFATAAAMGATYHTAYVALVEIGGLKAGQTVLVHGASGGVGLAACDLARALGATVIAATHREDKVEPLRRIARPDAVILNTGRFREDVSELTDGKLCDLVYDPIGGDVFDESTRCVAFGGKLLVIGFVSGRIPEIAVNIPLIKGFSVIGVRAGEYARRFPDRGARIAEAVDRLAAERRIRPHVDRTLPLTDWREAFEAMQRGEIVGKIVLEP
ncbi:NADPH:quinone oxidoreductase family protein [Erythrobacter sp.]|uniref:NADPH:quinone oxidoreductase family protein n=1 Tax=Erythrobacter sp. TaxID=1042 RepID=UPI001B15F68E|nr:NADPH:quinone oxidoreductase family protein [Erythrobacter sp.]MBO6526299.1 NADPH:quinone oxidoreductase family protein [Erythrobacter sp.]MBO6530552.1 NADPH:quinone oxidoreductase family protein [Erythrobacter sp.]